MFGNNYTNPNPYGFNNPAYGYNTNMYPSYSQPVNTAPQTVPTTNTNKIFVNGVNDVRNRSLPQNSDFIFLDNDKPLLYQKVVDSKGQFEVKVYDIVPHQEEAVQNTAIDLSQYVLATDFEKLVAELNAIKIQLGGMKNESIKSQQSRDTNVANAQ